MASKKVKIKDLAEEFGASPDAMFSLVVTLGIDAKSKAVSIEEAQADRVRRHVSKNGVPEPKVDPDKPAKKAPAKKAAAKPKTDDGTETPEKKPAAKKKAPAKKAAAKPKTDDTPAVEDTAPAPVVETPAPAPAPEPVVAPEAPAPAASTDDNPPAPSPGGGRVISSGPKGANTGAIPRPPVPPAP
ncbi:MAG: translation initiation factor, partial [Actinomycetota bacterium]